MQKGLPALANVAKRDGIILRVLKCEITNVLPARSSKQLMNVVETLA